VAEAGSARSGSGRNFCEQQCEQKEISGTATGTKPTTFIRAFGANLPCFLFARSAKRRSWSFAPHLNRFFEKKRCKKLLFFSTPFSTPVEKL